MSKEDKEEKRFGSVFSTRRDIGRGQRLSGR
jgi:hypothetical protein